MDTNLTNIFHLYKKIHENISTHISLYRPLYPMSTTKKQLEEQLKSLINSKAPKKLIDTVKEKIKYIDKPVKK